MENDNPEYILKDDSYIFDEAEDKWAEAYVSQTGKSFFVVTKWGKKMAGMYFRYPTSELEPLKMYEDNFTRAACLGMSHLEDYVTEREEQKRSGLACQINTSKK
jgi:hypothetical protein